MIYWRWSQWRGNESLASGLVVWDSENCRTDRCRPVRGSEGDGCDDRASATPGRALSPHSGLWDCRDALNVNTLNNAS